MTSACLLEMGPCHASSGGAPQQGDAGGSHWQQQDCVLLALSIHSLPGPAMAGSLALREMLRKISSSSPPSHPSDLVLMGLLGGPMASSSHVAQHCYAGGSFPWKTSRRGESVSLSNRHHFLFLKAKDRFRMGCAQYGLTIHARDLFSRPFSRQQ